MENLIFVKLGGGLITDKNKPYTPKTDTIERLAREISEARKEKKFNLVLGNGAGSFGHVSAKKYNTSQGFINKESRYGFCKVHNDVAEMNKIVIDAFLKINEKVFSIAPSAFFLTENSEITESFLKVIEKLLDYDIIPIVYGDVAVDLKKGSSILATEDVLLYLAKKLKPQKIIFANKVDGVFTDDPMKNEKAEFIPKINKENWGQVKKFLKGSDGIDVTGGMVQKVEKSIEMAKNNCKVMIINGKKPDYLKRVLLGETLGTIIEW